MPACWEPRSLSAASCPTKALVSSGLSVSSRVRCASRWVPAPSSRSIRAHKSMLPSAVRFSSDFSWFLMNFIELLSWFYGILFMVPGFSTRTFHLNYLNFRLVLALIAIKGLVCIFLIHRILIFLIKFLKYFFWS